MGRHLFVVALLFAAVDPADAVRGKWNLIKTGKARPGSTLTFSSSELNAFARSELPVVVPQGVRQPRLELGSGAVTGYALVDFIKLRHAQGQTTSWIISKLIEGEKPVKVNVRIESAHGRATVYLQRVEIGGLAVSGTTLDFLIQTFFLPLYPNAEINRPFELHGRIDHIEVSPAAARIVMKR